MKAQDLKKSILQYAMQGKLVPQDPNDEPASELLKRIRAEKDQLIKDGKIKKEKPLPPITQDEISYALPQGWQWVRLGDIIKISSGNFLPAEKMNQNGKVPVYGGNGINGYHDEYLIDKPTLIIGRVGFYCGCVHLSKGKAWVTDNAFITQFSEKNIDIKFLQWLLIFSDLGKNDNATAQPVVSGKKIYPLVIPLPPLAEQMRIVEKLEEILPLVDEYGKNEEILSEMNQKLPKQIRQSILQYAVQGKLVVQNPQDEPASELLKRIKAEKKQLIKDGKIKKEKPLTPITQDEIPYDLPQGWQWVRLGEITSIARGGSPRPIQAYLTNDANGIPWIKIGDTQKNGKYINSTKEYIIPEGISKSRLVHKGDFLLTNSMSFGRPYILNIDGCIHDGWLVISNLFKVLDNNFLYYLLSSNIIYVQFCTSVSGAVIQNLNSTKVADTIIPLPPLAEQKRIVAKIEELLNLVNKWEEKEV